MRGHKSKASRERGVALILALIAIVLLSAIGAGLVLLSSTEVSVDANYRDEQIALFAARAGLEEARDRMLAGNANPLTLPTVLPSSSCVSCVLYIVASGEQPWSSSDSYPDVEFQKEMGLTAFPTTSWYTSTATNSSYSGTNSTVPYKWVRVQLKIDRSAYSTGTPYYVDGNSANAAKQVCWNGKNEFVSSTGCTGSNNSVYQITAFSASPSGTRRMLQYEVANTPMQLAISSALLLDGTGVSFTAASSANYEVDGDDGSGPNAACASSAGNLPGVGTVDAADTATIDAAVGKRSGNYIGVGGSTPNVTSVASTMSSSLSNEAGIVALVQTITGYATQTYSGATSNLTNWGTFASPVVAVVNGDFSYSGNNVGYGILVVTGSFSMGGKSGWQGIVLALGGYAAHGTGEFDGAVIVANAYAEPPTPPTPNASLGSPSYDISGGGSAAGGIYYSSCAVSNALKGTATVYKVLVQRELMFTN